MKKILIVSGSRGIAHGPTVWRPMEAMVVELGGRKNVEVVQGGAPGVDSLADQWCQSNRVDRRTMYASWDDLGKAAGTERNQRMIREALASGRPTSFLAIWDGKSPGTKDFVLKAREAGLRGKLVTVGGGKKEDGQMRLFE